MLHQTTRDPARATDSERTHRPRLCLTTQSCLVWKSKSERSVQWEKVGRGKDWE